LGAPIEFARYSEIVQEYGPGGIQDFVFFDSKRKAWITDDTQMTLFTAESILRANTLYRKQGTCDPTVSVFHSYLRW
jgi:ADP-ribosylglycohydrolase